MSEDSSTSHRDSLHELVTQTEDSAARLRTDAKELLKDATEVGDLAGAFGTWLSGVPDDSALPVGTWTRLSDTWRELKRNTDAVGESVKTTVTYSTSSSTAAMTTAVAKIESTWISTLPSDAATEVTQVLERRAKLDEVCERMRQFGLDRDDGRARSPITLVREAHEGRTHGTAAAVLIPARASLNSALDSLLQRRPLQQAASNVVAKVESIGGQCGRHGATADQFSNVGQDLHALLRSLAGAKEQYLSRGRIDELFTATLLFFDTFLGLLDHTKFR